MELNSDNVAIIATAALAVSEALSLIPQVKANGIFQMIVNIIKKLSGKQ